jgi:soluble lytic murein transglycosylase-like protein
MQLMPATAKELGVNAKNPEQNVEGGSRYLQRMINKYDSQEIALAAYNWGPGNIDRAIRKVRAAGKRVTWSNILNEVRVPKETRQYVSKVTNLVA